MANTFKLYMDYKQSLKDYYTDLAAQNPRCKSF